MKDHFLYLEYAQIIRSGFVTLVLSQWACVSSTTRILLRRIFVLSQFLEAVKLTIQLNIFLNVRASLQLSSFNRFSHIVEKRKI